MLLAIDSSTHWTGLCLYDSAARQVLSERVWRTGNDHCRQLVPAIDALFAEQHLDRSQLRSVAVAVGPGTYNGVRVGVTTAKMLAHVLSLPLIAVQTLELYAMAELRFDGEIVAFAPASRDDVVVARYRGGEELEQVSPAMVAPFEELLRDPHVATLFVGEMTENQRMRLETIGGLTQIAPPSRCVRRPSTLAEMAAARLARNETDDAIALAPTYVRPPHITSAKR